MSKIKAIEITRPGSPPDIDTDFHTDGREKVIQYCVNKYGADCTANIITRDTFKARSCLKSMCTIYNIPYLKANKISALIPPPIDGDDCSIDDLVNPSSMRYAEGADFREATSDPEWKEILDMAIPFDGRIKGSGVHACGLIFSAKPLSGIVPTQIRQDDGALISQWTYPECENLGLFKMDFLGLDTINIVDHAVENIRLAGKEPPDMQAIVDGPMNDKKTFEMLQRGDTIGIFQLGSDGMRDLLRRVKPTEFMDISAITALYRPGPMKSNAHIDFADRKNGKTSAAPVGIEAFAGSELDVILKDTYGLLVYQESCMQIATRFADMTPYESDLLRKAIGKKKRDIMLSLKPKFVSGIAARGYKSQDIEDLWNAIEQFGSYGFNKSHSVSYAINAYKTAYLKANYPAEFMAALIQQNTNNKLKLAMFIQEANKMGLSVKAVDINRSCEKMTSSSETDKAESVIFGLTGVNQVNLNLAEAIVKERAKGKFTTVQNFIERLSSQATLSTQALRNLAYGGAFDKLNASRKLVVDNATALVGGCAHENTEISLFDLMSIDAGSLISNIKLDGEDLSYSELIKREAESIGFFVSGHPTANLGQVARSLGLSNISSLADSKKELRIAGTFTLIESKTNKSGNRSIAVTFDDGTNTFSAYLSKAIVKRIEKAAELQRIEKEKTKAKLAGIPYIETVNKTKRGLALNEIMLDSSILPMVLPAEYDPIVISVSPGKRINIQSIDILNLCQNGSLPFEVKVPAAKKNDFIKLLQTAAGGNTYIKCLRENFIYPNPITVTAVLIRQMESLLGLQNIITRGI